MKERGALQYLQTKCVTGKVNTYNRNSSATADDWYLQNEAARIKKKKKRCTSNAFVYSSEAYFQETWGKA